tara:strand:+ start:408 stop:974 length:567 start_codon:yes stop_codon:yes gene_type:complete
MQKGDNMHSSFIWLLRQEKEDGKVAYTPLCEPALGKVKARSQRERAAAQCSDNDMLVLVKVVETGTIRKVSTFVSDSPPEPKDKTETVLPLSSEQSEDKEESVSTEDSEQQGEPWIRPIIPDCWTENATVFVQDFANGEKEPPVTFTKTYASKRGATGMANRVKSYIEQKRGLSEFTDTMEPLTELSE